MTTSVVTGGCGFLGSHLCDRLEQLGHQVIVIDNLSSGNNLRATLIKHDMVLPMAVDMPVDFVWHLASPASPADYMRAPIATLEAGSTGTRNALNLALAHDARFLFTSSSEVYGCAQLHPQAEGYWGHVNPIGPRSVYDESKRFSEALTMAYSREFGIKTHIARLFNVYGPRMRSHDGRVIPTFLRQALAGDPLTIYGDGFQTRSFCWVDDTIEGLVRLMASDYREPVNIGNPQEVTVRLVAREILDATGSLSMIDYLPLPQDDPLTRCPDITLARETLGWEPVVSLADGIRTMVEVAV